MNHDLLSSIRCIILLFVCLLFASSQTHASEGLSTPPYYTQALLTDQRLKDALPLADRNYQKLREILPLYQKASLHPWPMIPDTKTLKRGVNDPGVALLRTRLQATDYLSSNYYTPATIFDEELALAVKKFQHCHGLKADGIVGKDTRRELNVPAAVRAEQIAINMQRWEELSSELNDRFIMVNVPAFKLYVFENNREVLSMKAIVGKPNWQTPEISARITRLVFHPAWNIPRLIAKKDIIPKVMNDPNYLEEFHIRIFANEDTRTEKEINPDDIDWQAVEENGLNYVFRQDPGDDNALGLVKFEFYNSSNIYLHDTPAKDLFDKDKRDFSHGCIRLKDPLKLVDYLMKGDPTWDEVRLQDILDTGQTTDVKAARPTHIIITYVTVWVDENDHIQFRDDVYGKDVL